MVVNDGPLGSPWSPEVGDECAGRWNAEPDVGVHGAAHRALCGRR
ncbi:hypothetical protein DVS28_b0041 (plasmid) [Euzebya pacifica]|uniref:Uncharacterized protein n=1 Tax=Euzebya pacifica TaxID=1608957 RepID=A0A346Y5R4_9ACTN|nr:hypothetical protein DVS28_b0041 [Euzebya pacifica]